MRCSRAGCPDRNRAARGPLEEKISITRRCAHDLLPAFEDGRMAPVIDRRLSLWDVAEAHECVASNANVGKSVAEL